MEFIVLKLYETDTKVWSFIDCRGILCDLSLVLMNLDFMNLILNKISKSVPTLWEMRPH